MNNLEVFICGDFYGGNRIAAEMNEERYDSIFGHLLPIIKNSDVSVVNLESPIFDDEFHSIAKTGPNNKANSNVALALKYAGFDLCCLANNHILDFGEEGLESTCIALKNQNIDYIGVGNNIEEAGKAKFIHVKSKTIAFINFCENEWSIASTDHSGANPFNIVDNFNQIKEAKLNADYVIVVFHGGIEHFKYPSLEFKKNCRFFVDAGADSVICHHTHVVSGYEMYQNKPIFYGLGNFIFHKNNRMNTEWNEGMAVKLIFNETIEFQIFPFLQCNGTLGIERMDKEQENAFFEKLTQINNTILNNYQLQKAVDNWVISKTTTYDSYLQPTSNKFFLGLFRRKLLPSVLSKSKYRYLLNIIRCESHRLVLLEILSKKVKSNL